MQKPLLADPHPRTRENTMNDQWIDVCAVGEIDEEDVLRFDHGPHTYALYRLTITVLR